MYQEPYSDHWTRSDDKKFEQALVFFPEDSPDRWLNIAHHMRRPVAQVLEHYDLLLRDVYEIDSGQVELPTYLDDDVDNWKSSVAVEEEDSGQISFAGGKTKHGETERKKGTPWTEAEHKLFLIGLSKYGKGDWRSISRNIVVSRTPTQVASHAQKYFLRQISVKKERKRSSIHDITNVDMNAVSPCSLQGQNQMQQQEISTLASSYLPDHHQQEGYLMGFNSSGFPM